MTLSCIKAFRSITLTLVVVAIASIGFSQEPVNSNGGFESSPQGITNSIDYWELAGGENVTYEIVTDDVVFGGKALKAEMVGIGTDSWSVQIINQGIPMQEETLYRYQIWAKADKPAQVNLSMNVGEQGGYDEMGSILSQSLTDEWTRYSFVFYNNTSWEQVYSINHLSLPENQSLLPVTYHFDELVVMPATTAWTELNTEGTDLTIDFHYDINGDTTLINSFTVNTTSGPVDISNLEVLNGSQIHFLLADAISANAVVTIAYNGEGGLAYKDNTPKNFPGTTIPAFEDPVYREPPPPCPTPMGIEFSEIASSSATVTWDRIDENLSWQIKYGASGFDFEADTLIQTVASPTLSLSELEMATAYDIYIMSECENSRPSQWAGPYTFTTLCDPFTTPIIEKFDGIDSIPLCWGATGLNSYTVEVTDQTYLTASRSVKLQHDTNSYAMLVSPEIDGNITSYRVNFMAMLGDSPSNAMITVGTMSTPDDSSTFEPIQTLEVATKPESPWHNLTVYLTDAATNNQYIAFKLGADDATGSSEVFLDNIVIEDTPDCPEPFNIYTDSITQTSANIYWSTHGTASTWNIEWGETGFEQGEGTLVSNIEEASYSITELEHSKSLSAYIQSNCTASTTSQWAGPFVLLTEGDGVIINEMMASNQTTMADEDGDYEDWVELYNYGNEPVNLEGWGLSDDYDRPFRWTLPDITMQPYEYLLVWASGKDRTDPPVVHDILITEGSEWRYLDDGTDQGTAWREADFDDSQWAVGPAMLGYNTSASTSFGTDISYGNDANNKHIAYYFRSNFEISNADRYDELELKLMIDDGAVVYINGQEVVRQNMPSDSITYTTFATEVVGELDISYHTIPASYLVNGTNSIAVQVHQVNSGSSDIRFDLELWSQGRYLHTNFSISSSGEEIILTNPVGERVDEIPPQELLTDVSIGRWPNGIDNFVYFSTPTPSEPNHGDASNEILTPPSFSYPAGFYADPFELSLVSTDPDVTIIYTLDGSEPDPNNLDGSTFQYKNSYPGSLRTATYTSQKYSEPIYISDRTSQMEVFSRIASSYDGSQYFPSRRIFKGMVVKARTVKEGAISSTEVTQSFFITPDLLNHYALPVMSITTQADNLFDYYDGIYVPGVVWDEEGGGTRDGGASANYHRRGREWEIPAHLEFFDGEATNPAIAQNIGVRLHGNWSRAHAMKTLRLYARTSYGNEFLNHRLFPDLPYDSYKRVVLRNSGNDWTNSMFRDAAIHATVAHLEIDVQAYRPIVLFINGEYWGIHNIRERYDRFYLARTWGVDPDNVDILTNENTVKEGDNNHYNAMLSYIRSNDISQRTHYNYLKTQMDVENFIDYQITHIYSRNTDWPGNNIDFWRYRTDEYKPDAPPGHDGRWRWMVFDTDFGYGIWNNDASHNTLQFAQQAGNSEWPNPDWSTFLLRNLLDNEEFKKHFINRFADLINTTFLPSRVTSLITEMRDAIAPEMEDHIVRWGTPSSYNNWRNNEVEKMLEFVNERPDFQRSHISQHFNLSGSYNLTLDVSSTSQGHIRLNTLHIEPDTEGVPANPYPWSGVYFQGVPIELEAVPQPGYIFSHWEGVNDTKSTTVKQSFTGNSVSVTAHFREATSLHYWHFNNLTSGSIELITPDQAEVPDGAITYPGDGNGYMDMVEDGTITNALSGTIDGQGLRVRNPANNRELLIEAPTTGYEQITFSYATKRTDNGANTQVVQFRTAPNGPWYQFEESVTVTPDWALHRFNFPTDEVNNNPDLTIRIQFQGEQAAGESGNNRFDNIRIEGLVLGASSDCCSETLIPHQKNETLEAWHNNGTLRLTNPYVGSSTLTLYSTNGAVLANHTISGMGQHALPFTPPYGVYIARLRGSNGVSTARFVVKN